MAELGPYFESAEQLAQAGRAFDEAEFDWCGSMALGVHLADDDADE
jgi:hypothetical protein